MCKSRLHFYIPETNNQKMYSERNITVASNVTYIGINLTKGTQRSDKQNDENLRDIKDLNKWRNILYSSLERLCMVNI